MAGCFLGEAGFSQGAHNAGGLFKGPELTGSTLGTMGSFVSRRGGTCGIWLRPVLRARPRAGAWGPRGFVHWVNELENTITLLGCENRFRAVDHLAARRTRN